MTPEPPRPARPSGAVHAALVAVQIGFASLSVTAKIVLREMAPRGLIALRSSCAALLFLLVWAARGRDRVSARDMLRIALYALFGVALNQLLFIEGLQRTTATNATVLGASIPVFTLAVALVLRRESATGLKLVGLAVSCAGALAVTGVAHVSGDRRLVIGNLLVIANSLSFSIYLVISRDVLARYRPATVITFTFLFGALMILPFGAGDFARHAPAMSTRAWIICVYIVTVPSVMTYFLNAWALARVESSLVAVYIYLQPFVAATLAAIFLGERPGLDTAVGATLIFTGIWLVGLDARLRRRARVVPPPAR